MSSSELYGSYAQLVESVASTPVATDTNIIFIGACASGDLNKAYVISGMSDYSTKLGGAVGDGYNLTEGAIAAFQVAGLRQVTMIPVSHSTTFSAADYVGDGVSTGASAIVRYLAREPKAVVVVCAPSVVDSTALAAILAACKKADGHWDSFMLYDTDIPADSVNSNDVFVDADEVTKALSDEQAVCCLGKVKTSGGDVISLAAVRSCLMAVSDSNYGAPARSGGNLAMNGVVSWGDFFADTEEYPYTHAFNGTENVTYSQEITLTGVTGNGSVHVSGTLTSTGQTDVSIDDDYSYTAGKFTIAVDGDYHVWDGWDNLAITSGESHYHSIDIPEADSTQLSANGVCAVVNYSGTFYTWGDHTSAFTNASVSDERARFDNTIRMNLMITNRFQLKYRFEIDNPMTLAMRNDVIDEELDFLNGLVAIGALIGTPEVAFKPEDNATDQVAQGRFTWTTYNTPTIPSKYMLNKVAYTQAGLSVYTQAE